MTRTEKSCLHQCKDTHWGFETSIYVNLHVHYADSKNAYLHIYTVGLQSFTVSIFTTHVLSTFAQNLCALSTTVMVET